MRSLSIGTVLTMAAAVAGCLAEAKDPEEELEVLDGKSDTHLRPTDHGAIAFAIPAHSVLTDEQRFHAWTFELTGDAKLEMTTSYSVLGQRRTDTVLYLYREGATGWGPYIARNDDYGSTTYSQLKRTLGAGRYRVLVKGHLASTRGKFKITVTCTGAGCAPVEPPVAQCVFGDAYYEIPDQAHLSIINSTKIYPDTLSMLNPEDQHRLMLAVQQSSHTDVTTPAEAILRVDQHEVNVVWIAEPEAQRTFIAFEYGAGDNSYGAIFSRTDGAMVTNIHDGDLENCTVKQEDCLFPDTWTGLRNSTAFTRTSARVVTAQDALTGVLAAQVLDAFRVSYGEPNMTLAEGFELADENQINVHQYRHVATGEVIDALEWGAGDTSVGSLFYAGTLDRAGEISDLAIEKCTFFAP